MDRPQRLSQARGSARNYGSDWLSHPVTVHERAHWLDGISLCARNLTGASDVIVEPIDVCRAGHSELSYVAHRG